jgi:hypothetical protein
MDTANWISPEENQMKRQEIEQAIVKRVIADTLAAGYSIDVFDGDEFVLENGTDADAIFKAMFATDEEQLYLRKDGKRWGWIFFIYGENGWDVINNHTSNLDELLKGTFELCDELEAKLHV